MTLVIASQSKRAFHLLLAIEEKNIREVIFAEHLFEVQHYFCAQLTGLYTNIRVCVYECMYVHRLYLIRGDDLLLYTKIYFYSYLIKQM